MTIRRARTLLLCLTVILCALALFPAGGQGNHNRSVWHLGVGISGPEDVAFNLLLFVPFGILAAAAFGGGARLHQRQAVVAVGGAALLSLSIEMLQTLIPSRFPSLVDVAANTAGALMGLAAYHLWRTRQSALLLGAYVAFACVFSLLLGRAARLTGWDEAAPLLLGNEATGNRLWSGKLWRVDIANRVVDGTAVRNLLNGAAPDAEAALAGALGDSVIASYDFASNEPCHDRSGHLPALVSNKGAGCTATGTAAELGYRGWLRTSDPARTLTSQISRSGQFALAASLESANNWQTGPARIVSLSTDADRRNFTLAQRGADFVVRIRTPLTGHNGTNVELVARNAVLPGRRQAVAVTYDGGRLSIFVDHPRPRASISLGPGLALARKLVPDAWLARMAHAGWLELLYVAGVFAGLGLLVALMRSRPERSAARWWGLIVTVATAPLVFELVMHFGTGRRVDLARPLVGLGALMLPVWGLGRVRAGGGAVAVRQERLPSAVSARVPVGEQVRRFAKICLATTLGLMLVAGEASPVPDLVAPPGRSGRFLYAAPDGVSTNDGSRSQPLDLPTLLGAASPARPGDTVWLLEGTYRGHFVGDVAGTAEAPVVVRRMPGSRVTLDGGSSPDQTTLLVRGPYVWYWGFEVTNSDPRRLQHRAGNPTMRGTGIDVRAPGVRIINVVVHDAANGIAAWSAAEGAEVSGSLVYFNGIEGTDRGHGHGIYVQNTGTVKRLSDNIIFAGFGAGIHAYTENGFLDNLQLEGNVAFNNGALSAASEGMGLNILLGGLRVALYPVLRDNVTYVANTRGGNTELGYRAGCREAVIENNHFIGADPLSLTNCEQVVMRNNTLYGRISPTLETTFPENRFVRMRPLANEVLVRPNHYERGRAHIVVFNWEGLDTVDVSAARAHLRAGDRYEIRDAQNFYGAPVATGTYSGRRIMLPMSGLATAQPVGAVPLPPKHSGPVFGVFVMVRAGA